MDIAALPAGRVVVTISDLESLFERMVDAERRARHAEAEAESLRGQARFMYGQLSELRRQLEAGAGQAANGTNACPPTTEKPAGGAPVAVTSTVGRAEHPRPTPQVRSVIRTPESVPSNRDPRAVGVHRNGGNGTLHHGVDPPTDRPVPAAEAERRPEELVGRLRRIYSRLDEFRREEVVTPEAEQQRQRALAAYDRELVAVCAALRIPTGLTDGEPVSVEVRAALTRALAKAGHDVRDGVRPAPTQKGRRIRPSLRF